MNNALMDHELLMEFAAEAREHFDAAENDLLALERAPDDDTRERLDRIFRAMHTVKGSAGFLGLREVSSLSHVMETVLSRMRKGLLAPDPAWITELLGGLDDLRKLLNVHSGETKGKPDATRLERMERRLECPAEGLVSERWTDAPKEMNRRIQIHWDDLAVWQVFSNMSPLDLFLCLEKDGFVVDATVRPAAQRLRGAGEHLPLALDVLYATALSDEDLTQRIHVEHSQLSPANLNEPLHAEWVYSITLFPSSAVLETPGAMEALWADLRGLGTLTVKEAAGERTGWHMKLTTHAAENAVRDAFIFVENGGELTLEKRAASRAVPPPPQENMPPPAAATEEADQPPPLKTKSDVPISSDFTSNTDTLRVSSWKLDHLVNLAGELAIAQAQLASASSMTANAPPELFAAVESMERLGSELRTQVLNIRMIPIGNTFAKYRRIVRDLAAELGKNVDLEIAGGETELDKSVMDQIGDPLVHLVRNSLDHGIEKPEVRVQHGKPERGRLTLAAQQQGDRVLIRVADDGRGLDTEAIRKKAEEQGLIPAAAELSEAEIHALIFSPGFSTAHQVTKVSGRGVGMDVVKRRIELLRGGIEVRSEPGKGSEFILSLPLTLAIIDGLMVEVDGDRFIIPLSIVTETIELTREQRRSNNQVNRVDLRGSFVPCLRLRDVFGFPDHNPEVERVVMVRLGGEQLGLVVDVVVGNHQTVLKSLGRLCRDMAMFSGANVLGDGTVALVLDVPGLLRQAEITSAISGPQIMLNG